MKSKNEILNALDKLIETAEERRSETKDAEGSMFMNGKINGLMLAKEIIEMYEVDK